MAKRKRELDNCHAYRPAKYPHYDKYPPLERDFYSMPVNDVRKHSYHLRPREHYHYYGRVPQHPALAACKASAEESKRNAHSYSINGHRHSNSSTASSLKRRLMTFKEDVDLGLSRRHQNAVTSGGDDRGHVSIGCYSVGFLISAHRIKFVSVCS